MLKPEGKLGILVPISFLSGSAHSHVRERLFLEELTVHVIVELPRGLFPQAASAMAVLLGEKAKPPPKHKPTIAIIHPQDPGAQLKLLQILLPYVA
ncbi:MAG: N-6 DNA methylase [Bacteroidia bacterium]|nr:N-6 DNA methylase [Bacteroidia bacterium]MDW8236458.1 N-6 DNA methylase [Bacteroidia bacterium]